MKDIKDYLHLYPGALSRHRYVDYKPEQWTVWTKLSYRDIWRLNDDASIDKIEIQLRLLSDMTEDENIESGKYQYPKLHEFKPFPVPNQNQMYRPELFRYLLSKHFDLFGLIESGLSIDKTKTNILIK